VNIETYVRCKDGGESAGTTAITTNKVARRGGSNYECHCIEENERVTQPCGLISLRKVSGFSGHIFTLCQ